IRYKMHARIPEGDTMTPGIQLLRHVGAITIAREYGSGGGEIATRLGSHLGWQLIDREIVERVASEMGNSIEEAKAYDERTEGILARVFKNLQFLKPAYMAGASSEAFLTNEET